MTQAKFSPGQIIRHNKFGYRGVIVDVDPEFAGTEEWYETVAKSRPPKDRPWYHVLVDGETHATYVAERHLEEDDNKQPVEHPALENFFDHFEDGRYYRKEVH